MNSWSYCRLSWECFRAGRNISDYSNCTNYVVSNVLMRELFPSHQFIVRLVPVAVPVFHIIFVCFSFVSYFYSVILLYGATFINSLFEFEISLCDTLFIIVFLECFNPLRDTLLIIILPACVIVIFCPFLTWLLTGDLFGPTGLSYSRGCSEAYEGVVGRVRWSNVWYGIVTAANSWRWVLMQILVEYIPIFWAVSGTRLTIQCVTQLWCRCRPEMLRASPHGHFWLLRRSPFVEPRAGLRKVFTLLSGVFGQWGRSPFSGLGLVLQLKGLYLYWFFTFNFHSYLRAFWWCKPSVSAQGVHCSNYV